MVRSSVVYAIGGATIGLIIGAVFGLFLGFVVAFIMGADPFGGFFYAFFICPITSAAGAVAGGIRNVRHYNRSARNPVERQREV